MRKVLMKNISKLIFVAIFTIGLAIPTGVLAANFGDLSTRIAHNTKMYNTADQAGKLTVNRYRDKSLKDMQETGNKSISTSDQTIIKNLATQIIDGNTNLSSISKLKAFHNFIRDNLEINGNPEEVLGSNYNNPVTIAKYYNKTGSNEIPATNRGYAALFVALARSYNIPARVINGYFQFDAINQDTEWGSNVTTSDINHYWCEAYINGKWIVVDIVADDYTTEEEIEDYGLNYFNVSAENISKTHLIFSYRKGSTSRSFIDDPYETTRIKAFLNKTSLKVKNGKRINKKYTTSNPTTWFSSYDKTSIGDGSGKVAKLILKDGRKLYGSLDFSNFKEITYFQGSYNKITKVTMTGCPKLKKVYLGHNKIKTANFTKNKKLEYLSLQENPVTYVKYGFNNGKSYAIVKSNKHGTITVLYQKTSKGYKHTFIATPDAKHDFKGWYNADGKLISKKEKFTIYKSKTFKYTAKYEGRTGVYVSIKNQRAVYYEKGKIVLSTSVVTGNTDGQHNTPKGTFKIEYKQRDLYLKGPDYESWVNYWMSISNKLGVGFHDATWRSSFGGEIYKGNGSHGCINLPFGKAKQLYEMVPKGTKVVIK